MSKNILIFSDGTGQAGGLRPDQRLSNIYKLYRATRVSPDNNIDPNLQIAFYDEGLGSGEQSGPFWTSPISAIRKTFAAATGGGISRNMVDCYEAILQNYVPGDRIFLFGFSRGGYTIRCVANMIALCGVPTPSKDKPLARSGKALRAIAEEAVYKVYDHCAGRKSDQYRDVQSISASRFREKYGSHLEGDITTANVAPYFIGAFDSVSALGMSWLTRSIAVSVAVVSALTVSYLAGTVLSSFLAFDSAKISVMIFAAFGLWALITFFRNQLKVITSYPSRRQFRWHFAIWRFKNGESDEHLDTEVGFARHALAIDEMRASFSRVRWGHKAKWPERDESMASWFVQKWFAGNHSDIGGSYSENESRLSDIALGWMIEQTQKIPFPLIMDCHQLHLFPQADGMQHCEIEALREKYPIWWPQALRWSWPSAARLHASGAPRHPTVDQRLLFDGVQHCDQIKPYRPLALIYDETCGEICRVSNQNILPVDWKKWVVVPEVTKTPA